MFALRRLSALSRNVQTNFRLKHTLPPLPYEPSALEPVISCEIMELHHKKHHAAYINNYNAAEEQLKDALNKNDTAKVISLLPALKFNGGGHINHSIFWKNLSPQGGEPSDDLKQAICDSFGSFDEMKKKLMAASNSVQGSGWGWLGYNKVADRLQIATTANQDTLESTHGLIPLFGIDVWEHAYYLQYKNVRADYTKKILDIINWEDVSHRLEEAKC